MLNLGPPSSNISLQYSDKRKDVCIFLFNDLLLLTKLIKKGRYKLTAKISLKENARLEIMPDNASKILSPFDFLRVANLYLLFRHTSDFLGQEIKNAFVLHTPRVSYLLFCTTPEDRTAICSKISNIVRLAEQ